MRGEGDKLTKWEVWIGSYTSGCSISTSQVRKAGVWSILRRRSGGLGARYHASRVDW